MTTLKATEGLICWHYLPWALSTIAVMIAIVLRRIDLAVRRDIMRRLMPRVQFSELFFSFDLHQCQVAKNGMSALH